MLHHLIQLGNGPVDLVGTGCLFLGSGTDFLDQLRGFVNIRQHLFQHASGFFSHVHTAHGTLADFLGCLTAAFGQLADFGGDNRKALAGFPRPGRFDSGV